MTKIAKMTRRTIAAALVAAAATASIAAPAYASDGHNRVVEIINYSGVTIEYLNASNVNREDWGHDHLGQYILRPGQSLHVNFDDYTGACHFDMRATYANGATAEARDVNVCAEYTVTFY